MAFTLHRHGFEQAIKAPSALSPGEVVELVGSSGLLALKAASVNIDPWGIVDASVAAGGYVTVYEEGNVVKVTAAASVGVGVEVGIASTNGNLGPLSVASGTKKYAVGVSMTNAAAGEKFSVYIKPRLTGVIDA